MQRITITLDDSVSAGLASYMAARGYANRSEAIRDLIRDRLAAEHIGAEPEGECLASLSYVYNHHERELAARLVQAHHDHHDLTVSTLHVHLDHDHCMETVVLRGAAARVSAFADAVIAQPGVRQGHLHLFAVRAREQDHAHGPEAEAHRHLHLEPLA